MQNDGKHERALHVFEMLCNNLEAHDWTYKKNLDALTIETGVRGDDLPILFSLVVEEDEQLVLLISPLPFLVSEDKRIDMAVAVSAINNILADGSFDYDIQSGRTLFRMVSSFLDSDLGDEVLSYMIAASTYAIDEFNDKLLALSLGSLSLEKFMDLVK